MASHRADAPRIRGLQLKVDHLNDKLRRLRRDRRRHTGYAEEIVATGYVICRSRRPSYADTDTTREELKSAKFRCDSKAFRPILELTGMIGYKSS
jgi:hypothetical protein